MEKAFNSAHGLELTIMHSMDLRQFDHSENVSNPAHYITRKTEHAPLVSAIIPCLNEELTLFICINKIMKAFTRMGIQGEVIVGDNGSTDKSVEIATSLGARVIHQPVRGYGAAISAAAGAAKGKYLIMADADDSYDWSQIDIFVNALESGADFVMGNRFAGGIEPGAMPPLHRYLGNPLLSGIARVLYHSPIHDFHCGMRAFTREAFQKMSTRSTGMEFASEMIINAHRAGLIIQEVPIKLYPDKRNRPPHLRSFRDGWRHLRLLIAHAPDRMYLIPGITLLLPGVIGLALLAAGPVEINGYYFGIHFVALATMSTLIGLIALLLGVLAKVAIAIYHPVAQSRVIPWLTRSHPLEWLVFCGSFLAISGFCADLLLAFQWISTSGSMEHSVHAVFVISTACIAGVLMVLTGFVLHLLLDSLHRNAQR
ncbi:glycosyltransferase family 2 protein [Enterobacter sp.]|uniref:glycosyltransferase family 2 protein n=1 Tax=Enterobacter sp. TaxID=42895 RepID=UPI00296EE073|nr:glycosyltransferase family 2 protein [Enterobacter sp.]